MWTWIAVLVSLFTLSFCQTVPYRVTTCDGVERKILGAHLYAGAVRGLIQCRYAPQAPKYALSVRLNKLNLQRNGGYCPTLKIIAYTELRVLEDRDERGYPIRDKGIREPSDPITMVKVDCNDYKKKIGSSFRTEKLGQKIQIDYDTKLSREKIADGFDIIVTSYTPGRSWSCEGNTFRCWADKFMCIDSSLECDNYNNCNDNSDEEAFKCTKKIAGIHLPLFIIIILLILILLIGLIVGIILYRRRMNRKKAAPEGDSCLQDGRPPIVDHRAMQPLYPSAPTIMPPEASIAPSSSHQYSAYGDRAF